MCAHEDPTARETKEERYGRVSGGICALHFIHVVALSLTNAAEKAVFILQHTRQSLKSSSDNSPGIFLFNFLGQGMRFAVRRMLRNRKYFEQKKDMQGCMTDSSRVLITCKTLNVLIGPRPDQESSGL
jgi:hypothetical protein